jgi:hypothetical protein
MMGSLLGAIKPNGIHAVLIQATGLLGPVKLFYVDSGVQLNRMQYYSPSPVLVSVMTSVMMR